MKLHRLYFSLSLLFGFAGLSGFWVVVSLAEKPDPMVAFGMLAAGLLLGVHYSDKAATEARRAPRESHER